MNAYDIETIIAAIDAMCEHLTEDVGFMNCVRETTALLAIEDIDLANELGVSRTTVLRWKNGRAVPYPGMRKPVYAALRRRALTRLEAAA